MTFIDFIYDQKIEMRLDRWLRRTFGLLPQGVIEKALRTCFVRVNDGKARSKTLLNPGDKVSVEIHLYQKWQSMVNSDVKTNVQAKAVKNASSLDLSNLVLTETPEYLILNKPSGLAVQNGLHIDQSVDQWITHISDGTYRLVHRIDRDTSGLLLIAKTWEMAVHLTRQFRNHDIQKTYRAVIFGTLNPPNGVIDLPLSMDSNAVNKVIIDRLNGKEAQTHYHTVKIEKSWSDVELYPRTGRKHQLRVHLAVQGTPIVGDQKYDPQRVSFYALNPIKKGVLYLHAYKMEFVNLQGEKQTVTAPLPEYWPM